MHTMGQRGDKVCPLEHALPLPHRMHNLLKYRPKIWLEKRHINNSRSIR